MTRGAEAFFQRFIYPLPKGNSNIKSEEQKGE